MRPARREPAALGAVAALAAVVVAGRSWAARGPAARPTSAGTDTSPRPSPPGDLRLSVVVPAYQEEARIAASVRRIAETVAPVDAAGGVEVVVVDDGSSDATAAQAGAAGGRVVRLDRNRGKGAAVRAGMLAARGRAVAFVDADLAYPPEQVLALLAEVESGSDVVVGNRRHPASTALAREPWLRRLSGRAFNVLAALVVLGRPRDTQCGCKAFRSDAARLIFSQTRVDGFAFDVEVFHLAERQGLRVTEVPVTVTSVTGSTVRVGLDALRMVRDLVRIRRWSRSGAYGGSGPCNGERPAVSK